MIDFIEIINADHTGEQPVLVRKSQVVAIEPNGLRTSGTCYIYLRDGGMFHVKQPYNVLIEQFEFE